MARKVFFSFHYQRDIFRVNVVRNSGVVEGSAAAGFHDASLWEEAKKKGEAVVKKLIDDALNGTTVTVVLIGAETANRKYVDYDIKQSLARGNGLLGIHIDQIPTPQNARDTRGRVPAGLTSAGAPVYDWDRSKFGAWVETAFQEAQKKKSSSSTASWMPRP